MRERVCPIESRGLSEQSDSFIEFNAKFIEAYDFRRKAHSFTAPLSPFCLSVDFPQKLSAACTGSMHSLI